MNAPGAQSALLPLGATDADADADGVGVGVADPVGAVTFGAAVGGSAGLSSFFLQAGATRRMNGRTRSERMGVACSKLRAVPQASRTSRAACHGVDLSHVGPGPRGPAGPCGTAPGSLVGPQPRRVTASKPVDVKSRVITDAGNDHPSSGAGTLSDADRVI
jgi:hypothetical protein